MYTAYRFPNTQAWHEHEAWVFGARTRYLFFRPAAYVDGQFTGMRFHLGSRRTP